MPESIPITPPSESAKPDSTGRTMKVARPGKVPSPVGPKHNPHLTGARIMPDSVHTRKLSRRTALKGGAAVAVAAARPGV